MTDNENGFSRCRLHFSTEKTCNNREKNKFYQKKICFCNFCFCIEKKTFFFIYCKFFPCWNSCGIGFSHFHSQPFSFLICEFKNQEYCKKVDFAMVDLLIYKPLCLIKTIVISLVFSFSMSFQPATCCTTNN